MAEEEKQETEETTEEAAEEQAPEAQAAEEAAPDGTEETAPEPEATVEAPAEEAEPEEVLSPKELRKRERSRASGPAQPQRTTEDRASERAEARRGAAVRRRRYRAARRGEPGEGTPKADREPGSKKVRQGTVVSAAADKTITVEIPVVRRHPTYEKVVRQTSKLHAHDEANSAQEGDVVRVIESRPLSRSKRWRLLDVVERSR